MKKLTTLLKNNLIPLLVLFFILVTLSIYQVIAIGDRDNSQNGVVIRFADNITEAHKKVVELFNEKYKGRIKVEVIHLPFEKFSTNERKELLARSFRNKSNRIDIFAVDLIWVKRFAKWAEPIEDFTNISSSELVDYTLQSCYQDSVLVAVPLYVDIGSYFLLKGRLNEKQKEYLSNVDSLDWDDIFEMAKLKEGKERNSFIFQADDYEGLICFFFEMLGSINNGKLLEDDNTLPVEQTIKTLEFIKSLIGPRKIAPKDVLHMKEIESIIYILQNDEFLIRGWPSFEISFRDLGSEKNIEPGLEKIAVLPAPGGKSSPILGGWNIMISKSSEHKKEAAIFLEFLVSEEAQKTMYEVGNHIPAIRSIYEDEKYLSQHHELEFYMEQLKKAINRPFLDNYTQVSDIISYYVHKALSGDITPEKAIGSINSMIRKK